MEKQLLIEQRQYIDFKVYAVTPIKKKYGFLYMKMEKRQYKDQVLKLKKRQMQQEI